MMVEDASLKISQNNFNGNDAVTYNDDSTENSHNQQVHRQSTTIMDQSSFNETYEYHIPEKPSLVERLRKVCLCSNKQLSKFMRRRMPVLSWLPSYNFKNNFLPDFVAGITLAIVQIPQAMAFTMLSSASPVLGLYATFFATAIYFFFGTSKYSSLGMAGITAMVVGQAINSRLHTLNLVENANNNESIFMTQNGNETISINAVDIEQIKAEVATTMAFIVGILQVLMGIFDLGCLSIFFSDVMMRACTMASVLQMIIGQLPLLLGISIGRPSGPLSSVYNLIEICQQIPTTNFATLIISVVSIIFLLVINEGINARYRDKMKIPIPTEIILITVSTLVSYYVKLNETYGVKILNEIPTGFPKPVIPQISIIPQVLADSVVVTILTFTIIMSQAKVLSSKYDCTPDISQELFANGIANVIGSFFTCMPSSFAFVRCVLLIQLGAKSMMTSLVCSITLLLVLLFIAPVFEPLPHSVLAAILLIALAEILLDLKTIKTTWKSVKTDSILIITSFIAVFLLDLQYGIAVGILISMIMVLFQTIRIKINVMGNVLGTNIYLQVKKFKKATELDQIKILSVGGPLFFGTKDKLKRKVDVKVLRAIYEHQVRETLSKMGSSSQLSIIKTPKKLMSRKKTVIKMEFPTVWSPITSLILDFSLVTFMDTAAMRMLTIIKADLDKVGVALYIASPNEKVEKIIERSELKSKFLTNLFPTIHEAVKYCQLQTSIKNSDNGNYAYDNAAFVKQ
ncbi:hypothetical protein CHUAL_005216 [Chamberlinius hualienensis]